MVLMRRILLGMILLSIPLKVFAWDWNTKITVSLTNQPLSGLCDALEQQYGIHFSYSRDIVNLSRKVTINVHNKPLKELLDDYLTPYDIDFTRIGGQIVLTMKKGLQRTVSGYIQDQRTGERLIGATVYSFTHQQGTVTNQYGFFSITLPKDTSTLVVVYIGYERVRLFPEKLGRRQTIVQLLPMHSLQEFVVSETPLTRDPSQTQMGKINLSMDDVNSMPRLLGEADVMRTLTAMPGVTGGMDGSSSLNVRGGSSDQNLVLLDGTPVFNASHLLGIFSVFNADIVKNTEFYKSGFPARYGGRLSSIVDISTKDGNMQEYHGDASAGLMAAKFMVEGPIKKDKTSFLISARRSFVDVLLNQIYLLKDKDDRNRISVYFYDTNIKLNHIFSPKDRIYLSGYIGDDHMGYKEETKSTSRYGGKYEESSETRFGWGNAMGTFRWNHVFSPRIFSNVTLNYSRYAFLNDYRYSYHADSASNNANLYGKYYSKIRDGLGKIDFEYRPNPLHTIKFGGTYISHEFNPGVSVLKNSYSGVGIDTSYNDNTTSGQEAALYAEEAWTITDKIQLNVGVHAAGYHLDKKWFTSLQPRIGWRYQLPKQWTIKGAYTHMNQYLHLLADPSTSLPTDLWVPSTSKVTPMFSKQLSLGVSKSVHQKMFVFSAEAYYKSMDHVIEYKENAAIFSSPGENWDNQVVMGTGRSYGGELLAEKRKGKLHGWIGYTLAWSDRQFDDVNKGKRFPFKYDRRHDLEVVAIQKVGKKFEFSMMWEYTSGMPITLPTGSYEAINESSPWNLPGINPIIDHLGKRNAFRTRSIHRLDFNITYTKQKKYWVKSWILSIYNIYNKQNSFFYSVKTDREKNERYLAGINILPFLPSITYALKF